MYSSLCMCTTWAKDWFWVHFGRHHTLTCDLLKWNAMQTLLRYAGEVIEPACSQVLDVSLREYCFAGSLVGSPNIQYCAHWHIMMAKSNLGLYTRLNDHILSKLYASIIFIRIIMRALNISDVFLNLSFHTQSTTPPQRTNVKASELTQQGCSSSIILLVVSHRSSKVWDKQQKRSYWLRVITRSGIRSSV